MHTNRINRALSARPRSLRAIPLASMPSAARTSSARTTHRRSPLAGSVTAARDATAGNRLRAGLLLLPSGRAFRARTASRRHRPRRTTTTPRAFARERAPTRQLPLRTGRRACAQVAVRGLRCGRRFAALYDPAGAGACAPRNVSRAAPRRSLFHRGAALGVARRPPASCDVAHGAFVGILPRDARSYREPRRVVVLPAIEFRALRRITDMG